METMRIEALEAIKSDGYLLSPEDVITVPREVGVKFCFHGWARDISGAYPTGDRSLTPKTMQVDSIVHETVVTAI